MRTINELANEALAIQNACNLCGLSQAFAKAMLDLNAHVNNTSERNAHAITRLWLDKFNSLAGIQSFSDSDVSSRIDSAYDAVKALASPESALG